MGESDVHANKAGEFNEEFLTLIFNDILGICIIYRFKL